ncbi:MAG: isoleucine--tRNA ligase [Gammaproteobacteria bacterium]
MAEYKDTLNLPQTDFPMRAALAQREPDMLADWEARDLYGKLREAGKGRPAFLLPDGPPYANGDIHLGHCVNKVLKDIVIRARTLDGFDAPYIPGWDCHGLPIELVVEREHGPVGKTLDAKAFRDACRSFARAQVDGQRRDFRRLGVLGDWDRPYLTMDPAYEAEQLRAFGRIMANGHVYKGFKPVHWCLDCGSALAEAEVEYADKKSPAIDVRYRVVDEAALLAAFGGDARGNLAGPVSIPIWTTTPWTLPASQAVALHPELEYALISFEREAGRERIVVARDLLAQVTRRWGIERFEELAVCRGGALEGLALRHPYLEREVPVILGEHVTIETGTGAVHTAPGHGQDDFIVGQRYGLAVDNPVLDDGRFREGTDAVAGLSVFAANPVMVELLKERGALLHHEPLQHSYPHCWRHKTPLIFRATPQWFVGMDREGLRERALQVIGEVRWMPAWGEKRIRSMVEGRPDWCISRQRTWGVPIALFVNRETGEPHPDSVRLLGLVADRVEREGIDAWWALDPAELLGEEAARYEKVRDIMDVWVDSGLMHHCLSATRDEVGFPADLYLEGSDQHRGWFQSSLLTSVAMHGKAPYRGVLTHGFTVDEKGRKMSKSLGNVVAPQKVLNTLGADILRLWVAATDYRGEMSVSDEILKRMSDSYRRMRNTVRFLLGNLHGFDPAKDAVAPADMIALDRWAVARTAALQAEVVRAYEDYEFHLIYQKVHNFCVLDMGGFYLDVLKDRLYTTPAAGHPRRSAQTAMYHVAEAMVRWLAPILAFTSEEIWSSLPGERAESVLLARWHALPDVPLREDDPDWDLVHAVRDDVAHELEALRNAGRIGSSLDAELVLYAAPDLAARLRRPGEELRFLLLTSDVRVEALESRPADAIPLEGFTDRLYAQAVPTQQPKCVRCWHRRPDIGSDPEHPEICGRCAENVSGPGETRQWA